MASAGAAGAGLASSSSGGAAVVVCAVFGSALLFAVVERLLHAAVSTLWYVTIGFDEGETKFSFGALQLLASAGSALTRVATSIINVIMSAVAGLVSWFAVAFAILCVTGLLYVGYEQYPILARGFTQQWNQAIGPRLHANLVLPLDVLNLFLGAALPLYNTVVWVVQRIVVEGMLMPLITSPSEIFKMATASGLLIKTLAQSAVAYFTATFRNCNQIQSQSVSLSSCIGDVGIRTLDLITPMTHLRDVLALGVGWISVRVCSPLATPLDIAFAPFMDINFAKAVHNLVNAVLWTVLQTPIITEARCRNFQATEGVAMCLPDFEPAFRFTVEGLRTLGMALDNWIDIVTLIIQVSTAFIQIARVHE